jgi:hypothetical protein
MDPIILKLFGMLLTPRRLSSEDRVIQASENKGFEWDNSSRTGASLKTKTENNAGPSQVYRAIFCNNRRIGFGRNSLHPNLQGIRVPVQVDL